MKLLKVVEIESDGTTKEAVNFICYHPIQEKMLLRGEKIEPICCAVYYEYDSIMQNIYNVLGWQGGTIHQIIEEIKRLKLLDKKGEN